MWTDCESNVLVLGHRGMCALYPENTLVSFRAALDARVDLIEMDVHLTSDKVPVICHDGAVDRTTDGTGYIKNMTFAQLQQLDAGAKKAPKFRGERIPSFREFLELIRSTDYPVLLNVEIKGYTHETADAAIAMLDEFSLLERSVIACFDAEILRYVHSAYPHVKTQGFPGRYMKNFTEETYDGMYGMGIPTDWTAWAKTTPEQVREDIVFAKSRNIKPWLFCSDTEETVRKCVEYGTYNVTGNDPLPALKVLPQMGVHTPLYANEMPQGTMKAANLHAVGELVCEQLPIPQCGEDEVLVKIKNCGVCGSDIGRILKKGTYHFPTVPGHEFAGKVVYDRSGQWLGKGVAVFPLLPCFRCSMCAQEKYAQCENYDYYGSRRDGAFAEYLAVKKWNLMELPANVTYEEGAMCEPVAVALHATRKLGIQKGDRVLITGAGPIGLIAGMWAKSMGAESVSYIDLDQRKLELAKSMGFLQYCGKEKVDRVLEGTGAGSAIMTAIEAVKVFGQMVFMGNPSRNVELSAAAYQNILRKELSISGTWNSAYNPTMSDWQESLQAVSESKIVIKDLVTHRVSLDQALEAVQMMAAADEFYCKVMIDNEK